MHRVITLIDLVSDVSFGLGSLQTLSALDVSWTLGSKTTAKSLSDVQRAEVAFCAEAFESVGLASIIGDARGCESAL